MYVKSIELINLKSYKQDLIELSPNINLLIGANNSGKSTIIKALMNLQYRNFEKRDIRANEQHAKIFTNIVDVNEKDNHSFDFKNGQEIENSDKYTVLWNLSVIKEINEEHVFFNSTHNAHRPPDNKITVTHKTSGQVVPFKTFGRFPDREDKNNFIYPFLARRRSSNYDLTVNQEQTFMVSEGLYNLAAKIQKISNSSHPRNSEFNELCEDILGFKVGVIHGEQNSNLEPGIFVTDTYTIPMKSMGDGVANIVGFIVILLTENNKLFLIEELENDIHPKALKKLLKLISRKAHNNQFVISTHSHIILKYLGIVPKTKIFYIDWKPNLEIKGIKENIPTSFISEVENSPEKRIEILEKLGYDFHDFELYEGYLILEESSAEKIIRGFLIPNFFPNLFNKIKTIAAKGVDDLEAKVQDFSRLFVFIHTSEIYYEKAWVIADGDSKGVEHINSLKGIFKNWPEEHFINFKESNFEKYYPRKFQERVSSVLNLPHGLAKQNAKTNLLNEVMEWALINRDEAMQEFQESAKEVLEIIKGLESKLIKKDK